MGSLGTFGDKRKQAEVEETVPKGDFFEFGEFTIWLRAYTEVSPLPMMEFARIIQAPIPSRSIVAQSVLHGVLEACVHPDSWELFRTVAFTQHGVEAEQALVDLAYVLYGGWAGIPFQLPQDSSNGPMTKETAPSSSGSSPRQSRRSKRRGSSAQSTSTTTDQAAPASGQIPSSV